MPPMMNRELHIPIIKYKIYQFAESDFIAAIIIIIRKPEEVGITYHPL